jgi:hypothetical protein
MFGVIDTNTVGMEAVPMTSPLAAPPAATSPAKAEHPHELTSVLQIHLLTWQYSMIASFLEKE